MADNSIYNDIRERVGARAINALAEALRQTHPSTDGMTPDQWVALVGMVVMETSDRTLLRVRDIGKTTLARIRAEWPYEPKPPTHCPCCGQPLE